MGRMLPRANVPYLGYAGGQQAFQSYPLRACAISLEVRPAETKDIVRSHCIFNAAVHVIIGFDGCPISSLEELVAFVLPSLTLRHSRLGPWRGAQAPCNLQCGHR